MCSNWTRAIKGTPFASVTGTFLLPSPMKRSYRLVPSLPLIALSEGSQRGLFTSRQGLHQRSNQLTDAKLEYSISIRENGRVYIHQSARNPDMERNLFTSRERKQ